MPAVNTVRRGAGGLRRRITAAFLLLTLPAVLMLFLLLLLETHQDVPLSLLESYQNLASQLVPDLEPLVSREIDQERLIRALYRLQAQLPTTEIFILDGSRHLRGCLVDPLARAHYQPMFQATAGSNKPMVRVGQTAWRLIDGIFVGAPLVVEGQQGYLLIRIDQRNLRSTTSMLFDLNVLVLLGWWVLVTVLVVMPLGLFISSRITRPFQRINKGLESFAEGDYSERLPASGRSEFDGHARALNQMADTIVSELSALKDQDQLLRNLLEQISKSLGAPVDQLVKDLQDALAAGSPEKRRMLIVPLIEHCERINESVTGAFAVARKSAREWGRSQ